MTVVSNITLVTLDTNEIQQIFLLCFVCIIIILKQSDINKKITVVNGDLFLNIYTCDRMCCFIYRGGKHKTTRRNLGHIDFVVENAEEVL